MKLNPRRLVLPMVLAAFFMVTMSPCALNAQSTQNQSTSSTTKTKKKSKKKSKKAKSEQSAAEANSSANTPATAKESKKSRKKKSKVETAASKENKEPAASSVPSAPAEPSHAVAKNERSHAAPASSVHAQTPPSPGMVWVNTESKVYHKSGSRWYGKTKQGQWMTEAQAQKAGYKAAKDGR